MADILDSADNPLTGSRWWVTAENPFQALATCIEIAAAWRSGQPTKYMCRLPVHQDGSCNGLQHYAGLGRDEQGAMAVNLVPSERPQDVYSKVLETVLLRISQDILIPADDPDESRRKVGECARLVNGHVDRKVIKQTVMTSVYGVTRTGARAQIQARLVEKFQKDASHIISPELETQLFSAATYVAGLSLMSLDMLFSRAKGIMNWLSQCSSLVSRQVY
jgi:DNA-directed RNA polymerase